MPFNLFCLNDFVNMWSDDYMPILIYSSAAAALLTMLFWLFSDSDLILAVYNYLHPNLNYYKGKVVWICGSSSGIGQQIAYELAEKGCTLILTATSKDKLEATRLKCLELSKGSLQENDVVVAAFNVTSKEEREKHFKNIIEQFGRIDVLINNAGVINIGFAQELTDEEIERQTQINYLANVCTTNLVVRHWIKNKQPGRVIANSSLVTYLPYPLYAAYTGSKAALNAYYNIMRMEVACRNISITVVCPGGVNTEMFSRPVTADQRRFDPKIVKNTLVIMPAKRCAHLMLVAGANRFSEVLVAKQPQVLGSRMFEMFGSTLRPIITRFFSQSMLQSFHDKILVSTTATSNTSNSSNDN